MRFTTIVSAGLLCGVAGSALACDLPKLAVIPPKDRIVGREAEISTAANNYFTAMQAYAACIQQEITAAGGDSAPDLVKRILVSRNNTAVAEAEFMMKLYETTFGPANPAAAPPAEPAR
ncbi:MAG TPA: hypothetical protein VKA43_16630 [Gammaproteobacteria bacterium]|nr:hypothetical protein [Gammaproteobacteria bacterium]